MIDLEIMIEHAFIFPPEEDLPIPFITWARGNQEGVSIKLSFLPTHTNVIVKGDVITVFNSCIFVLGQWHSKILNELPDSYTKEPVEEPLLGLQGVETPKPIPGDEEIFNPGKKKLLTYGECLGPAMRITDPVQAEKYLKDYIDYLCENYTGDKKLIEINAKKNLAYYSQGCDDETNKRVTTLFHCSNQELLDLQS